MYLIFFQHELYQQVRALLKQSLVVQQQLEQNQYLQQLVQLNYQLRVKHP